MRLGVEFAVGDRLGHGRFGHLHADHRVRDRVLSKTRRVFFFSSPSKGNGTCNIGWELEADRWVRGGIGGLRRRFGTPGVLLERRGFFGGGVGHGVDRLRAVPQFRRRRRQRLLRVEFQFRSELESGR